jgi:ADP-ribose pyrophosphatase YjhB (NUDIX family)
MTPIVGVGAFIFDADDRVLVIERGHPPGEGLWSVPGGRLEFGETLAQAVAREVREETGLIAEVGPLVCVIEPMSDDHHYVILDYLARVVGGALAAGPDAEGGGLRPTPGDDARAARFVRDDELAALPHTDGLLDVLARAHAKNAAWRTSSSR